MYGRITKIDTDLRDNNSSPYYTFHVLFDDGSVQRMSVSQADREMFFQKLSDDEIKGFHWSIESMVRSGTSKSGKAYSFITLRFAIRLSK